MFTSLLALVRRRRCRRRSSLARRLLRGSRRRRSTTSLHVDRRRGAVDRLPRRRRGDGGQPVLLRGRQLRAVPAVLVPAHRHVPAGRDPAGRRDPARPRRPLVRRAARRASAPACRPTTTSSSGSPSLEGGACGVGPTRARHLVPRVRLRHARRSWRCAASSPSSSSSLPRRAGNSTTRERPGRDGSSRVTTTIPHPRCSSSPSCWRRRRRRRDRRRRAVGRRRRRRRRRRPRRRRRRRTGWRRSPLAASTAIAAAPDVHAAEDPAVDAGDPALCRGADRRRLRLRRQRGRPSIPATDGPMMVVFLAHWCPHCNAEIPVLNSGATPAGSPRPQGRRRQHRRVAGRARTTRRTSGSSRWMAVAGARRRRADVDAAGQRLRRDRRTRSSCSSTPTAT